MKSERKVSEKRYENKFLHTENKFLQPEKYFLQTELFCISEPEVVKVQYFEMSKREPGLTLTIFTSIDLDRD